MIAFDFGSPPDYQNRMRPAARIGLALIGFCLASTAPLKAAVFRLATYNLENYIDKATESRRTIKSEAAKTKIRESIRALRPDVIALQEIGSTSALLELRGSLKRDGVDFPHWEQVTGFDTNIHVAVLSRFPFAARYPHTNNTYLLGGRRFTVSRGILEVEIRPAPDYAFTLISAHLKSQRQVAVADEAEMRLQEARIVREIVDKRLAANPSANIVVLGDLNSTWDSPSTKWLVGRGRNKLVDTRPAERNGDDAPNSNANWEPRNITWTHYYGAEDTYSRIDYILLSPGMAREWIKEESYVLTIPNWGVGSDHRPITAAFTSKDL